VPRSPLRLTDLGENGTEPDVVAPAVGLEVKVVRRPAFAGEADQLPPRFTRRCHWWGHAGRLASRHIRCIPIPAPFHTFPARS